MKDSCEKSEEMNDYAKLQSLASNSGIDPMTLRMQLVFTDWTKAKQLYSPVKSSLPIENVAEVSHVSINNQEEPSLYIISKEEAEVQPPHHQPL